MPITKTHIRFKEIRTTLGLSQIEFANRAQIKQAQVSQIETGDRGISDTIYEQLGINLNVNRAWLQAGDGEMFIDPEQLATANPDYKPRVKRGDKSTLQDQAKRLAIFRKQEQIGVEQLAAELNITRPTLVKYENGSLLVPTSVVVYLHNRYRMSYEWYFDGAGNSKISYAKHRAPVDLADLLDTQNVMLLKIDYLEKQLAKEKQARLKLEKQINDLSIQFT